MPEVGFLCRYSLTSRASPYVFRQKCRSSIVRHRGTPALRKKAGPGRGPSQGELRSSCHSGSGLVLKLRMNLSLQLGSEGTAAQPWVPENLRTSRRTLSWGRAPGENTEASGKPLGEGPGQRSCECESELPLTEGVCSEDRGASEAARRHGCGVLCSERPGWVGDLHSHGESGALALRGELTDRGGELEAHVAPLPILGIPTPPHYRRPCLGLLECSESLLVSTCLP